MDRDRGLVLEIVQKFQFDKRLKKYANEHFFHNNSIFGGIKSKEDIEKYENHVLSRIDQYKKLYPLVSEDIIDLEQAMGKFEIAVKKAIQLYDSEAFRYSSEELQSLIDKVFAYHDEVQSIALRKMMQD
ncbi:hypothetical protein [Paenibacillus azoreducens]|uniref:Uncharacterized protein n=1 Tax=Paenibacillus azoreducens TaxID=116718 RepID=A0A919YH20_9BACL|nr:hypothetical protein [Paenibacillus azoreducens]GIO51546.1 hypothetical protein J34TS1_63110 [Paenibacillus azoreducens]